MRQDWEAVSSKLKGAFFPAVPVPFNSLGNIDKEAQESLAQYMASQPVTGVAIWAHTGRGLFLTEQQREEIYLTWRKNLRPEQWIICGVGSRVRPDITPQAEQRFLSEAQSMAEQARRLGADAILVYPPTIYRESPDAERRIIEYHELIGSYDVPLILFYLYREAGGIDYSLEVLRHLLTLKQVVGIKLATLDSVMTFQDICRLIQEEFPQKVIITGEDRWLGYSYIIGAQGALVGLGTIFPSLQIEMFKAYFEKRYESFIELMSKVDLLAECTFLYPMEGYIERLLYVLAVQGIISFEAAHDPYGPGVTQKEKENILKILFRLGLLKQNQ